MQKNSEGKKTPLFLTVSYNSSTVSRKLLESGANAEEPDLDGNRPLMKAVQQGSKRLVALLLGRREFFGTIEVKQRSFTPLHEAARLGSDAICKLILRGEPTSTLATLWSEHHCITLSNMSTW